MAERVGGYHPIVWGIKWSDQNLGKYVKLWHKGATDQHGHTQQPTKYKRVSWRRCY